MDPLRETRELVVTLCVAAGTVLALPWALWSSGALVVVERLAVGLVAGALVGAVGAVALTRSRSTSD